MHACLWEPQKDLRIPGTGVPNDSKLPNTGPGNQTWVFHKSRKCSEGSCHLSSPHLHFELGSIVKFSSVSLLSPLPCSHLHMSYFFCLKFSVKTVSALSRQLMKTVDTSAGGPTRLSTCLLSESLNLILNHSGGKCVKYQAYFNSSNHFVPPKTIC